MKTLVMTTAVLSILVSASPSRAQRGTGQMYDPKTVETLTGEVVKVETFALGRGMSKGMHVTLKTDKETLSVHLGPSWYMDNQETDIVAKDRIEVTGSRITFEGKPALVAREIRKGDQALKLRDEDGTPLWAGWRRR